MSSDNNLCARPSCPQSLFVREVYRCFFLAVADSWRYPVATRGSRGSVARCARRRSRADVNRNWMKRLILLSLRIQNATDCSLTTSAAPSFCHQCTESPYTQGSRARIFKGEAHIPLALFSRLPPPTPDKMTQTCRNCFLIGLISNKQSKMWNAFVRWLVNLGGSIYEISYDLS